MITNLLIQQQCGFQWLQWSVLMHAGWCKHKVPLEIMISKSANSQQRRPPRFLSLTPVCFEISWAAVEAA